MAPYNHSKFTGYNSVVEILEENGRKIVKKIIHIPLDLKTVQDLEQRVTLQRSALTNLGIRIPELLDMTIIQTPEGYNLQMKEKFEGLDFVDVVDDSNFEFYIDRVLDDIFKPLFTSTKEDTLKVGIDPIARNFIYQTHENRFCYVDFIPPKVFYKGHYSQEIPEIDGPFYDIRMLCHNSRKGIAYVQFINFIRVFPLKRKFILGKFEQFLERIGEEELKEYIVNSPFYRLDDIRKISEQAKQIKDWHGVNYYYLREALCILAEYFDDIRENLSDYFKLTTHERNPESPEYGLLPQKNFEKILEIIEEKSNL